MFCVKGVFRSVVNNQAQVSKTYKKSEGLNFRPFLSVTIPISMCSRETRFRENQRLISVSLFLDAHLNPIGAKFSRKAVDGELMF